MHTIQEITETHLHCLDDNDYPYIISREHFEQWLKDTGRTKWILDEPCPQTGHKQSETTIDWYDNMAEDKSNDLKAYCKVNKDFIIAEVAAQNELT